MDFSAIEWANGLAGHWAQGMWPVLWQTAALAAIVGLIVLCARRMSPALRFWLWMLVPLRLLVMPLVTVTLPVLANPAVVQPPAVIAPLSIASRSDASPTPPDLTVEPLATAPAAALQKPVSVSLWSWLMIAWAIGVCLFSVRLARGWLRMKGITGQARENSDARVRDRAREAAVMLGLRKMPRIMTAAEGASPFMLGLLRPVVVLPAALADHVSPEELRTVLAHEFAHVRRRDALVGWVLAFCDVVYFFNPVFLLVKRRIIFERERACDEQVLALAQVPRAVYARALLSASGLSGSTPMRFSCATVLLESSVNLERRLKLIGHETVLRPKLSWTTKTYLLVVMLIALPGFTLTARSATTPSEPAEKPSEQSTPQSASSTAVTSPPAGNAFAQKETIGPSGRRPSGDCSISGKVVSSVTGEPVPKATVYLFCIPTSDALFIAAASDGSFAFKDIPAGKYALQVVNTTGFQPQEYDPDNLKGFGRLAEFALLEKEQRNGILFKLQPAYKISGRVLDENGMPFSDWNDLLVMALRPDSEGADSGLKFKKVGQTGKIGKTGAYSIDGLDGRPVILLALDWSGWENENAYPPCYFPGTFSREDAEKVSFDKGASVANVDIHWKKRGGLALAGTVTEEATGAPLPKALVVVFRKDTIVDRFFTYTDAQGHFRSDCFGLGEFQVDADATPAGFVRASHGITLQASSPISSVDFTLKRGVTISGRFVDEQGKELRIVQDLSAGGASAALPSSHGAWNKYTFSGSPIGNKYSPETVGVRSLYFHPAEGEYPDAHMLFPTRSSFLIQGMMPGKTTFWFLPKVAGNKVEKILYRGANVLKEGIPTKASDVIEGVEIVIGDAQAEGASAVPAPTKPAPDAAPGLDKQPFFWDANNRQ